MPAVRQVEALVAQGEIRNLLVSQRKGQARPVVERRIDDFVSFKFSVGVGQRDVTQLPAPALDHRDRKLVGR